MGLILRCREFKRRDVMTVEDWTFVLKLATQWGFASIRELSIDMLGCIVSPVEKLTLAHAYSVDEWLLPAYYALCGQAKPLTKEEGRRIGADSVILIHQVRECIRGTMIAQYRPDFIANELKKQLSENNGKNDTNKATAPNILPVSQDDSCM